MDPFAAGSDWLRRHGSSAAVVPHHDADGLAAGVLLSRRARGPVLHVGSPWEERLPAELPLVIADWGVRPLAGSAELLYVDHHAAPEAVAGTVVLAPPGTPSSTSIVAWELLARPAADEWLAALGAVGDMVPPDALERALRPGSASAARRLAALVTAPGRLRDGPVEAAFRLLADSDGGRAALAHPLRAELDEALARVGEARARALRAAPRVGPDAALIRFDEPARVHPLVASAWARRLGPRPVVAANDGWREGHVSFAVRSADGRDLRAWLEARFSPPAGAGDYARGHARATGGSLVPDVFERFAGAVLSAAP